MVEVGLPELLIMALVAATFCYLRWPLPKAIPCVAPARKTLRARRLPPRRRA